MGVATTHYVVFGALEKDKEKVKQFFRITEEHLDFIDSYDDNGYREEITYTDSGIHMIVDGMAGSYVVVGKILYKDLEGFPLEELQKIKHPNKRETAKIVKELVKIDTTLGTRFSTSGLSLIFFTHWH